MDLYEYGRKRFQSRPRPDWKQELADLYIKWAASDDDEEKRRIEDKMVLAYAPFLYWKSYQYQRKELGYHRRDAFEIALQRFKYSLDRFDLSKSPKGAIAFSSHLMNLAMKDMLKEQQRLARLRDVGADPLSLDWMYAGSKPDDDTYSLLDILECEDELPVRRPVYDVVKDVLSTLSPINRRIAELRFVDEVPIKYLAEKLRGEGFHIRSDNAPRQRLEDIILPALREALIAEGYDEDVM